MSRVNKRVRTCCMFCSVALLRSALPWRGVFYAFEGLCRVTCVPRGRVLPLTLLPVFFQNWTAKEDALVLHSRTGRRNSYQQVSRNDLGQWEVLMGHVFASVLLCVRAFLPCGFFRIITSSPKHSICFILDKLYLTHPPPTSFPRKLFANFFIGIRKVIIEFLVLARLENILEGGRLAVD